ncbi:MAG: hypothetical protein ACYTF0_08940, partial [Planctomycetota bacterium]
MEGKPRGMKHVKRLIAPVALLALVWAGMSLPAAAAAEDIDVQRDLYRQARAAIKRGDEAGLRSIMTTLGDYPLVPYLQIEALRRDLRRADADAVRRLLDTHGDLAAADGLRYDWLKRLARERRWADYVADYRPQRSVSLRCSYWSAKLAL